MEQVNRRRVILRPIEDGWWLAEVPSLPGCLTEGETREVALANIKEVIELYLEVLEEKGQPIPEDDYQDAELAVV
jgi:predicted RNase H-like HicB family nuclease